LSLARGAAMDLRVLLMERASQSVAYDLRTGLFARMNAMSWSFFDKNRVGEIMSRMTGDLEGVRDYLAEGLVTVFEQGMRFFGSLAFMFALSWQTALATLALLPLIGLAAARFRKKVGPEFRAVREQSAELNTRVQENLAGIHVVKAFVREAHEQALMEKENRKLLGQHLRVTWVWSDYVPVMQLLSDLCTPAVLVTGALLTASGRMDLGTLVGVTGYIWMLTNPMRMLSQIINQATRAVTSAEKLFFYMDLGSDIKDAPDAKSPAQRTGLVEFDHVHFRYGDQEVLSDISFTARPGQTVAVMGATGSGKSTLTRLIGRFYDVSEGRVLVDGVDVRRQPMKELRASIGYVPQETFLFSESIAENIAYGRPDADRASVEEAARAAQAEEFAAEMPQGYDTVVGERGVGLSGGQKQRTAIARALLIDPSILVLDDATSAVDMQTEALIQEALEGATRGRTTFVLAHRISSVRNADLILVLEGGRIAERGTHGELLRLGGLYARMYRDQLTSVTGEGGGG
ncbi:MAG TPA: ABC transporter ATP-binding protein, partial [Candidatus Limnocylindria bacterium]|nr:ABC transporter ATP-binding protein [Candidatus Limnocylindria bacterium]